jgi:hypothetical protein
MRFPITCFFKNYSTLKNSLETFSRECAYENLSLTINQNLFELMRQELSFKNQTCWM